SRQGGWLSWHWGRAGERSRKGDARGGLDRAQASSNVKQSAWSHETWLKLPYGGNLPCQRKRWNTTRKHRNITHMLPATTPRRLSITKADIMRRLHTMPTQRGRTQLTPEITAKRP